MSQINDTTLTDRDFAAAAADLGVEEARIRAVSAVESAGNGFLPDGRPKILFEGHIFWRELKNAGLDPGALVDTDPGLKDILYPKWDKSHYKGGAAEYGRLERAEKIHRRAALRSASWGMFQIMGNNCKACACADVETFVATMRTAGGQLRAFCGFIRSNPALLKALRASPPDWTGFAKGYNGSGYAQNKYDTRLAEAYAKFARA